MSRERLDDRRDGDLIDIEHIWMPGSESQVEERLQLMVGRYPDGRIAEVFIDYRAPEGWRKPSERTIALGKDVATLISIALQYGAPLEVLSGAMGRGEVNLMGKARLMPHTVIGTVIDRLTTEASK